jgi:hypothetical protein
MRDAAEYEAAGLRSRIGDLEDRVRELTEQLYART